MLLQDMVTRIEGNRANAAAYVTGDAGITGYVTLRVKLKCLICDPAAPMVDQDRCAWGQLLAGGNERIDAPQRRRLGRRDGLRLRDRRVQSRLCSSDRMARCECRRGTARRSRAISLPPGAGVICLATKIGGG